ncbi:MAG: orotidine-5'-phosphate decarboxylase [Methanomassiliicoccales archaeon]|nr:MAG: orotidine-5'-phosphate decarboxylase [Methanomassiliicoccales archaeon]
MKQKSGLILALDVAEEQKALQISESVGDIVAAIKVGYPLVLACGLDVVTRISKLSEVICDFKVADIPNVNRLIVENAIRKGASGIICHGFVGRDSIAACVKAAGGKDVFVVVEMSHPGGVEFYQPTTERFAKLAVEVGASGVIAPATRPERIKYIRGLVGELKILTPGVGAQGGSAQQAMEAGADYVIVGRSIYQADDPRSVAENITEEIGKDM